METAYQSTEFDVVRLVSKARKTVSTPAGDHSNAWTIRQLQTVMCTWLREFQKEKI
jgi:hypothetical protein